LAHCQAKRVEAALRPLTKLERAAADFAEAQRIWRHGPSAPLKRRRTAIEWYERAARSGVPEYEIALGQILCDSDFPDTENFHAGYRWILRAARKGHPGAQYWIARELATGENRRRNPKLAAHWYRMAAGQGLASAQYNLGIIYLEGDGVPKSRARAHRWILKAADGGEILAKALVADAYASGEAGFPIDPAKAAYWRKRLNDAASARG